MRGKVSKIAMILLVLCMAISMFSVNAFAADPKTPIDSCERIVEAYDLDDAEDYINDNDASTYPTCKEEGYLFAGWYTKETCTDDSFWGEEDPGDTVYALFVPSHVLSVKAQISSNLLDKDTSDDDTASIRFVTTVDTLYYRQAGFEVSYIGTDGTTKNATSASNKVYKKLYAIGSTSEEYTEDDVLEYTPEGSFCGLSTYFKACTVSKIGSEFFSTAFTVKPFWKTMDGSKVYGDTVVKSINDYFLAQDVWVSSTDANAADTVENGTESKPFATLNYALSMVKNGGTVHVKDSYTAPSDFAWKDHDKTVTITGGTLDFTGVPVVTIKEATDTTEAVTATMLHINDSVTFADTTLKFVNGQHIYANGNRVEIASDVTWGDTSAYVCIYGGAYRTALKSDTNLVLGTGNYKRVYGGGNYNDVTGDVNVTISGNVNTGIDYTNHTLTYAAFGGGENGSDIVGDINFTIANDNVLFDYVYGGGYGSKVTGDITVDFAGKSMSVYGGGRNGNVTGNTHLVMRNGFAEQLFGGGQHASAASNVYGNTDVQVLGGTVDRRIYGGCYNDTEQTIESYTSMTFSMAWKSTSYVSGYSSVTIADGANLEFDYRETYSKDIFGFDVSIETKVDNTLCAFTRHETVQSGETGVMIFNDNLYSTYSSKMTFDCEKLTCTSGAVKNFYDYLVIAQTGGEVYSTGDGLRIMPDSGKKATVRLGGTTVGYEVLHYTEQDSVCFLPELTSDTMTIYVLFEDTTPSDVDISKYEAKVNGGYYETLEEAIDAAEVLESEDVITISLLKDAEVESTLTIADGANIIVEGAEKYTINRADSLINGNIFNVKEGSTLTVDNVVLDGRITSDLSKTNLDEITGSTASLIYNAGTVNLQNMTGQYAVKTAAHGAVLQSGGSTDIVTVDNSTFSHNKAAGQGAAIRMGGSTKELTVTNSTFECNKVYTMPYTADDGSQKEYTGNGGAIGTHADVATIDNCTFIGNTATGTSASDADGCAGAVYSGTSSIVTMTGTDENALFSGNSVVNGAGGAVSAGSGKVTITGYTFESNTSTGNGGAIFSNGGSTKIKSVSCTFEGNTATGNGGVAYAGNAGTLIFDEDEDYTVEALAKNNTASGNGGVIAQGGNTVVKVTGYKFESNTAKQGGAIRVNGDALSATIKNVEFVSNSATSEGGAVYNAGTLTMTGTDSAKALFNSNSSASHGGAIYLAGKAEIAGYTFNGNTATGKNGGAICNHSNGSQVFDCQFISNKANQGGAVYSGGNTNTLTFGVTETPVQAAKFEGNESTGYGGAIGFGNGNLNVTGYDFTSNTSATYGGAIYTVGDNNTINITDVTFTDNTAQNGGAVCANGYNASTVITGSTFNGNSATENAGAVHVAKTTATVTIDDSSLSTNSAVNGGALYNVGSLTVTDSALTSNTSTNYAGAIFIDESTVTVENTSFTSNQSAEGGAIIVGRIEEVAATETTEATTNYHAGTLNATDCTFSTNKATSGHGGAIFNIIGSTATVTDTTFTSNESKDTGGAIYNNAATLTLVGTKAAALFDGNKTTGSSKMGGAIYNDGTLNAEAYTFENNVATSAGGAVANYGKKPEFVDCQFSSNTATHGGAIYNGGSGNTVYLSVSASPKLEALFKDNKATSSYGGAIGLGNGGLEVIGYTFEHNTATTHGGAIYFVGTTTSGVRTVKDSTFIKNEATNNGGAIMLNGNSGVAATIENCTFGGTAEDGTSLGNIAQRNGGAIYNAAGTVLTLRGNGNAEVSLFEKNQSNADGSDTSSEFGGGALCVGSGSVELSGYTFKDNHSEYMGGAIRFNGGSGTITGSTFELNGAQIEGGAISTRVSITVGSSTFDTNTSKVGGAISHIDSGTVTINANCTFEENTATTTGGAIQSTKTLIVDSSDFTSNSAPNGGAICMYSGTLTATDCDFTSNVATTEDITGLSGRGGGAINLVANSTATLKGTGTFDSNKATNAWGGAIYMSDASLNVSGQNFSENQALQGGAVIIDNATNDEELAAGTIQFNSSSFVKNKATDGNGGAICDTDNLLSEYSITVTDSTFGGEGLGNTATGNGGAIYTEGSSALTLDGNSNVALFKENSAASGGAIYKARAEYVNTITNEDGTTTEEKIYNGRTMSISGYTFDDNDAKTAGAVYITSSIKNTISNSVFIKNDATAGAGGAIVNYNAALDITNTRFGGTGEGNTASTNGGAIYSGGGVTVKLIGLKTENDIFVENEANGSDTETHFGGGAICIGTGDLNIEGYVFRNNIAGVQGGAIANRGVGTVINNTEFEGNVSRTMGGAIHIYNNASTNTITNSVFKTNKVVDTEGNKSGPGGAIYSKGTTKVTGTITGDTSTTTFIGNEATTGGAIELEAKGTTTANGCLFQENKTSGNGGAVRVFASNATFKGEDSIFKGNSSAGGGAIYSGSSGTVIVTKTSSDKTALFSGNTSTGWGGAIAMGTGNLTVSGYTFTGNSAVTGGAIRGNNSSHTNNISNAIFNGNESSDDGGAIWTQGKTTTITDCEFTGNKTTGTKTDGGAIYVSKNTLVLNDDAETSAVIAKFENNSATQYGSAVYLTSDTSSNIDADGYEFINNDAIAAGAICMFSTGTLDDCTFINNDATNGNGGAIYVTKEATYTNCTFETNTASQNGGAIWNSSTLIINGGTIESNSAVNGGAIHNGGTLTVTNGKFTSNQVTGYGGAVYMNGTATASFTGNGTFTSNTSSAFGGAIYSKSTAENGLTVDGYTFTGNKGTFGGAIMLYEAAAKATVSNCTFNQNEATSNEGGAVYINNAGANMTLTNCIFTNNKAAKTGGAITIGSGVMTINTTDGFTGALFQGNSTTSNDKGGAIYLHNGTLNVSGYTFENNSPQDIYKNKGTLNGDGNYTTNE